MENQIMLIGAGIVGNYLAILLRILGYDITVYEKGLSPIETNQQGKSINLAYSVRGQLAIEKAGITITNTVPMHGRLLHGKNSTNFLAYSQFGEALLSINRNEFNANLFQHAQNLGIKYYFQHNVDDIDMEKKILSISTCDSTTPIQKQIPFELLLGTDGSNTKIGSCLESNMTNKTEPAWQYIELEIKPLDNKFKLPDAENFHIWPKTQHIFLIGLPNSDGSFTLTLFVHADSNINLRQIQNNNDYAQFYEIIDSIVTNKFELEQIDIEPSFRNNKVSFIYTRVSAVFTNADTSIGLIGDALIAPPPFLGLACNAHMEAAYYFTEMINKYSHLSKTDAFRTALSEFYSTYMPNMRALLDASIDNAKVLSHSDPDYELKHQLTQYLERRDKGLFVEEHSLYSFTTIPLHQARTRQLWQSKILSELVEFPGIRHEYARLRNDCDAATALEKILDEQFVSENDRQLQLYREQLNM